MAGQASVQVRIVSNRLPSIPAAAKAAVSAEVKRAALDIQAQAQARAPVLTGTLRRSIHSEFPSELSAVVGPSVDYGIYVEMGSRGRGARPFLRPAADAVLPKFAAAVKAALGRLK
jgi:HK97 gp10 family phage protein